MALKLKGFITAVVLVFLDAAAASEIEGEKLNPFENSNIQVHARSGLLSGIVRYGAHKGHEFLTENRESIRRLHRDPNQKKGESDSISDSTTTKSSMKIINGHLKDFMALAEIDLSKIPTK